MRDIINISLPPDLKRIVNAQVKHGNFASTSEFFRHLLRNHQLARELERDKQAFSLGKGKILHSLKDLR